MAQQNLSVLSKKDRLKIFLQRLETAECVSSAAAALALLSRTLNAVEDEFSGVPFNPDAWLDDGRMYPPTESNRRSAPCHPSSERYRSARHNTYIGRNGSIQIVDLDGNILLDKPGLDGRGAEELDSKS